MKLATAEDMKEMDRKTLQKISSITLMEQAAGSVYDVMKERFSYRKKVLIICGPGNNGGDGYALAVLADKEFHIDILIYEQPVSEDAKHFYKVADELGIHMITKLSDTGCYDIIIDAMFGIGLQRPITGKGRDIVEWVNKQDACVLAIDMPSGIHADTGQLLGCAVYANIVVTFQFAKRGMYLYPGYTYGKEVIVKDIGIAEADQCLKQPIEILNSELIRTMLPKREAHSHKGTYGKVLIIGGSASMHGSITMAAACALRSGLGTLTLMIPDDIRETIANKLLEAMLIPTKSKHGYFSEDAIQQAVNNIPDYDVVMIGCGMGRSEVSEALVRCVLTSDKPCIIDADGLYALGRNLSYLKRKAPVILTPHPKEFSYLCHKGCQEILRDPLAAAMEFLKDFPNVTLVLKDERTLIFHDGSIYLNIRGNNALAKGGSGDVLCGLITGLLAQTKKPLDAVCGGVYLHALCAEILAMKHSLYTILPHDLYHVLDQAFLSVIHHES